MKLNAFHLVCCLTILALAAGCQSTRPASAADEEARMSYVAGFSPAVLADILAKEGFSDTNLVLEDTITFPPPAAGDKRNARSGWMGCFAGQETAVINAEDQVMVIATALSCGGSRPRYVFDPFTRTWKFHAVNASPETDLAWMLFNGKAKDFVQEVRKAHEQHELLGSMVRESRPVTSPTFPLHIVVNEMRNDLIELGLNALDEHLRTKHADGRPCNPDVYVYVKPAAVK